MLELETHQFQGTSPDCVLIVAGIHTSEQSGIEVARWILSKLAARESPTRLSAFVIPEVFPDRAAAARTDEFAGRPLGRWREDTKETRGLYARRGGPKDPVEIKVARQFPPPGSPLSVLSDGFLKVDPKTDLLVDGSRVPLLPEIEYLVRLIESLNPVRIVSVHGKIPPSSESLKKAKANGMIDMSPDDIDNWDTKTPINGVNFPGVFVDPRYAPAENCKNDESMEGCKFKFDLDPAFPLQGDKDKKRFDSARNEKEGRKDDALCLMLAKAIGDKSLVPGNHLDDSIPVVHYAREEKVKNNPGYSLGDWGPVDVKVKGAVTRPGAPVFTIEVNANPESWAFWDRQQMVTEDGKPLSPLPTPSERASGKTPKAAANPKFKKDRSKALQAYAKAIIDTILA